MNHIIKTKRPKLRSGGIRPRRFRPAIEVLEERMVLDDNSAGAEGILARDLLLPNGTVLTGSNIYIGMVESARPGKLAQPPGDTAQFVNSHVEPVEVYEQNGPATRDRRIDDHPESVAGIIIANGPSDKGVAPKAKLVASAYQNANLDEVTPADLVITMQHVATRNNQGVRAVNLSFGKPQARGEFTDGNSLFTAGLDWVATTYDTLFVVAGQQGAGEKGLPTDEFNGLTVAKTLKDNDGIYRKVDPDNNTEVDAQGSRRSIDLVAPGNGILAPITGGNGERYQRVSGTSFATPHVAGAVAILQEYAENQIQASVPGWDGTARRHLVSKAVLMNSADKLKDAGDGRLLGMDKTILKRDGQATWLQSDARDSADNPNGRFIPLDKEMGVGQLNVSRALTQFKPGNFDPGAKKGVPAIGWSFNSMLGAKEEVKKYTIAEKLKGGTYLAATLAWDRPNVLNDKNANGQFDKGETFTTPRLPNLNLYLLPKGATNLNQAIWSSESPADSVEHIFFQLPADGEYEIWVKGENVSTRVPYALAWWAVAAPPRQGRLGDGAWMDRDANGLQDAGEPGMAGVTVSLLDAAGNLVGSTTTDAYGNYEFADVATGVYRVAFTPPVGYAFAPANVGSDDALDSDADSLGRTALFSFGPDSDLTIDAGFVPTQRGSIGDRVWYDTDNDGVQDAFESGAAGVSVDLYTDAGYLVDTTTTDGLGQYQFGNVAPGGYMVSVTAPAGYGFSPNHVGLGTLDSDVYQAGATDPFNLGLGEARTDVDAGLIAFGSIGDFVWQDNDGDGVQDAGEPGLDNVGVTLRDAGGNFVAYTSSDASGRYQFGDLVPGSYSLEFDLPAGFQYAPATQGGDSALDSDARSDGTTFVFAVNAGQTVATMDAGLAPVPVKFFASRYRSFANTGGNEFYLGVDDLGVAANRVEKGFTWNKPGSYSITFEYDPEALKLISTVSNGGGTLEYNVTIVPVNMDSFEIIVADRDTNSQVNFTNVVLDGQSYGDFIGDNTLHSYKFTSDQLNDGFKFTGTIFIGGPFSSSQEKSRVEIAVGLHLVPPVTPGLVGAATRPAPQTLAALLDGDHRENRTPSVDAPSLHLPRRSGQNVAATRLAFERLLGDDDVGVPPATHEVSRFWECISRRPDLWDDSFIAATAARALQV